MNIKSRGSQTESDEILEEEIGGDEHTQGNNDNDLQGNAFWLVGLVDVAADISFASSHRGRRFVMPPPHAAWFSTRFLLGFWFWHGCQQGSQPSDLSRRLVQLLVEILLSRRLRCWLSGWRVDGDVYDGWLRLLARFFERCVVSGLFKFWHWQHATSVAHLHGVELLSLGEMKRGKRTELVSAIREAVFHAAYAHSHPGGILTAEPAVPEQAPLLPECSFPPVADT